MRKVAVDESVGMMLGYDITKIIPGSEKYRAFRKGQIITAGDIEKLKDMGKEHIYIWGPDENLLHEDEAALRLAEMAGGPVAEGAGLVVVTGGMSVDADDATPQAIRDTGADVVFYGAPILPGSQFMLAYQGHIPVCGVPGGALFSLKTTLDLLLPRIFAGDIINRLDIVTMGHGGLCEECAICHFPQCPFGKAT